MNNTNQPQTQQTEQPKKVFTVMELRLIAHSLYDKIEHTRLKGINGSDKYKRTVKKELDKLQAIKDENRQYSSTSIFYLTAIWNYCMEIGLSNVKAICKRVKYTDVGDDYGRKSEIIVDIICHSGLKWIKIKSKNPFSNQVQIIRNSARSNILMVADSYIKAAKENKIKFQTPKIEFVFPKGITSDVHYMLKTKGISIKGEIIKNNIFFEENENENQTAESDEKEQKCSKSDDEGIDESGVNLGPKCMMTMISALSNNEILDEFWQIVENYVIQREDNPEEYKLGIYQKALSFQYNSTVMHKIFSDKSTQMLSTMVGNYYEELQYPVMPIIMQYIGTKKLFCCQSAWDSVTKLVGMGAGQNEQSRHKQLQAQITVVPDQMSERTVRLKGKGMSKVNKAVFGTGDSLRMLTVAGAPTFARKARQKGVEFYCKIHDVRPFIEQYQIGFQAHKINKGFDIELLKQKMEEDDIDVNFDDSDSESEDEDDSELCEIQQGFEKFN